MGMDLNLELSERQTEIRDRIVPEIIIYQIGEIKKHFDENMESLQNQFSIADDLVGNENIKAAETIWRTQIVLLASAFDYFMHEIVWFGLYQMFTGEWVKSEGYNKLTVTMEQLQDAIDNPEDEEWFKTYITSLYKSATMMSYKDIKKYMSLIDISIQKVADRAFHRIGCTIKTKKQLEDNMEKLYRRRNSIAHQSDRTHEDAAQKPITKEQVEEFITVVNKIVFAIIDEVKAA